MRWWDKTLWVYHNLFNLKFALMSAATNGLITMALNTDHGPYVLLAAGATQGASSFVSTGIMARIVQHFSPIENPFWAYALGSFLPASLTFILSYGAHILNGTPEPFVNACPATAISFTTSFVTNFITRRGYFRPPNYPT